MRQISLWKQRESPEKKRDEFSVWFHGILEIQLGATDCQMLSLDAYWQ